MHIVFHLKKSWLFLGNLIVILAALSTCKFFFPVIFSSLGLFSGAFFKYLPYISCLHLPHLVYLHAFSWLIFRLNKKLQNKSELYPSNAGA